MKILELLDKSYPSTRAATRISILTSVYSNTFDSKDKTPCYIDEFKLLFAHLERMGDDAAVPESHKAPFLLASLCNYVPLEITIAV